MTEADWCGASEPRRMLGWLRGSGRLSDRKARLFAVACCRRVWGVLADGRVRAAVEAAERFADGSGGAEELAAAAGAIPPTLTSTPSGPQQAATQAAHSAVWLDASGAAHWAAYACGTAATGGRGGFARLRSVMDAEGAAQCQLLRDLFGNPLRPPPPIEPSLLTLNNGLVVRVAQAAYDDRLLPSGHLDPAHLAVLADALEEAGCMDPELLGHLRGEGPHVRGCWAVDRLLGRE